ncbi:MAG TPA: ThuA domain-containing protein [Rhodothermales bacterium]
MLNRRRFMETTALAAAASLVTGAGRSARPRALFVCGGWPGHEPFAFRERMAPLLESDGFEVVPADSLDVYADEALMQSVVVVIQQWTMGEIGDAQAGGLMRAVRRGVGLAGWHGGLVDSFRNHTDYQFMTGGQFVAHPGGPIDFDVHISNPDHPITRGLTDFRMTGTEQYYLHFDPAVHVLATTTFSGEHEPGIEGVVMPVAWTRRFGEGRIFNHTIGHQVADFDVPQVVEMTRRGVKWAAGR